MCRRILGVKSANPLDKGLHASLLKEAHERGSKSLGGIRGHLGNGGFLAATLLNVTTSNLLELEIAGDVGRDENVGQLARGHEELGNKVDVPVVKSTILLPRFLTVAEVAVLLEELCITIVRFGSKVQEGKSVGCVGG